MGIRGITRITGAALLAGLIALPAFAQGTSSTDRIDRRQANQEKRIQEGVKSGQLTSREAARLEKGQDRVQKMENKAMADGKMTKRERAKIEKAQDKQSRRIAREKHDRQHN